MHVTAFNGSAVSTSTGDHGLNLAYDLGTLLNGSSVTLTYAYAVGDKIDEVGNPGVVPEPATWAMMIAGFGMVGGAMRSARREGKAVTA